MNSHKQKLYIVTFLCISISVGILISSFLVRGGEKAYGFIAKKSEIISAKINSRLPENERIKLEASSIEAIGYTADQNKDSGERVGYFLKDREREMISKAESYLIGDIDTGEILVEKNGDMAMPIASVTKLMTALIATENYNLEEITNPTRRALSTYGSTAGIYRGEKIELSNLLYPLLLESSNPVAEVISEHKDRADFLRMMNEQTYILGMEKTFYKDPSGLSSQNISTVSDLFKLSKYIWKNHPEIFEITTRKTKSLIGHTWYNNNKLIYQDNYLGGKSGYTDEARKTGVAIFKMPISEGGETRNIAFIILKSEDRYRDTVALVNFAKSNLFYGLEKNAENFIPIEAKSDPSFKNWVDISFVGDIMLDRGVKKSVEKNFGGDFYSLFEKIKEIEEADIAFANLEGPVSDKGDDLKNLYSFRMNPDVLPVLKRAGFDALSIANNHIGDWGYDAFEDTVTRLMNAEMLPVGSGLNKNDAEKPKIIEKNGLKIGFLGFTDVGPNYLEANENRAGILLASDPRFSEIIQNASRQVDALIVSFHFGEEYKPATKRQQELARTAIDSGAKIVVGHHPHIAQEIEEYEDGLIIYSLGNFIFDQYFSEETMQGLMVSLELRKSGISKIEKRIVKLDKTFRPFETVKIK